MNEREGCALKQIVASMVTVLGNEPGKIESIPFIIEMEGEGGI